MVFDLKGRVFDRNKVKVKGFLSSGTKNFGSGFLKTFLGLGQIILGIALALWLGLVIFGKLMLTYINKPKKKQGIPKNYKPNTKNKEDDFLSFKSPLLDDIEKEERRRKEE